MPIGFKERWDQYGLIAYLAKKLKDVSPQFGKTVLQKLVYIMQELYGLPIDYDYCLYNYGPYCKELDNDLSYIALLDGVNVDWNVIGYKISPSKKAEHYIEKAQDFLSKNNELIDLTIQNFGNMQAKDLELRSTIIFVYKQSSSSRENKNRQELIKKVGEIKPHFSVQEIEKAYDELIANLSDERELNSYFVKYPPTGGFSFGGGCYALHGR